MWEKEKMLVKSVLCFSYNVFEIYRHRSCKTSGCFVKGQMTQDSGLLAKKKKTQKMSIAGSVFTNHSRTLLCLVVQTFLYLATFEYNTTSDSFNHSVQPIRSCFTFKFIKSCGKRQRMVLRMVGENGSIMQAL